MGKNKGKGVAHSGMPNPNADFKSNLNLFIQSYKFALARYEHDDNGEGYGNRFLSQVTV